MHKLISKQLCTGESAHYVAYRKRTTKVLERTLAKPFRIEMIANTMSILAEQINRALTDGKLRADAAENIRKTLAGAESEFAGRVLGELIDANEWEELSWHQRDELFQCRPRHPRIG
ncbi:MAG: hypothetical protein DME32_18500 [Verrucomicrobia bacterium]|nr:MAG: hypothetical protein DME32_18500 [Verrucomicrobiota bacterium]